MENERQAAVAIAQTRDKYRSQENVQAVVGAALKELGGIERFVRPGATVLIKPNVEIYYSAEEGCTTDPLVVGALIRLAKAAGASRVQVGESSGGCFDSTECMRMTGMAAVIEREGAELIDLGADDIPSREVDLPAGKVLQRVTLPVPLLDADVVINVPKAKTHYLEPISGVFKNWLGVVNQTWRRTHHGDEQMIERLVDILAARPPDLYVVDALIAGEGDGPIATRPRWTGCILASTDPVATDVATARLLDLDWRQLRFAKAAEDRGLGVRSPINFLGVPIERVVSRAWPGHEGFDYLPVNFIVGRGVTLGGTIGNVKSALDNLLARGELQRAIWSKGTPTLMLGEAEDLQFEEHLAQGPYLVFDDAALEKYKNDPRVYFVSGHPVLREAFPALMNGLGQKLPTKALLKWEMLHRAKVHNLQFGSPKRKALTLPGRRCHRRGNCRRRRFDPRSLQTQWASRGDLRPLRIAAQVPLAHSTLGVTPLSV
jgi:uncharacterized protein (DUF362 family)